MVPSTTFATAGLRMSEDEGPLWAGAKSLNSHVALGGRFSDGRRSLSVNIKAI